MHQHIHVVADPLAVWSRVEWLLPGLLLVKRSMDKALSGGKLTFPLRLIYLGYGV